MDIEEDAPFPARECARSFRQIELAGGKVRLWTLWSLNQGTPSALADKKMTPDWIRQGRTNLVLALLAW